MCALSLAPTEPFLESHIWTVVSGLPDNIWFPSFEYCTDHTPYLKSIQIYLWSDNCIVYLVFYKSQILIVWSCDPEAKNLLLGWAAIHSIEFKCALTMVLLALTWRAVKSCNNWYSRSPYIYKKLYKNFKCKDIRLKFFELRKFNV